MDESSEKQLIRRYLLGELPEAERAAVAARVIEDEMFFDQAREVENDLIDDLARGALSSSDAEKARRFLNDSGQNDRLTFAQALARKSRVGYRGPVVVGIFAGLAALFLCVLITAFYVVRKPMILQQQAQSKQAPPPVPRPVIFAFQLPPAVRGGTVPKIELPAAAEIAEVPLELEPGFTSYSVRLKTAAGRPIADASPAASGTFRFQFATKLTPPGKYEIEITGKRDSGNPEPLAFHEFLIER